MKKLFGFPLLLFFISTLVFFYPFFLQGKLPIPADTIVGLYHPFRDLYASEYPRGIPFKNFLITDPVRQQYPWRHLAIDSERSGVLPLWNPYMMAGTPLLATLQGGVFYPLNIILFILPFSLGWSLLIVLQPLLAGMFLYFYLSNLRLHRFASLLGAFTYAFSGFFIAWLEWGTILHVAIWLPLLLLSIDKLFYWFSKLENSKLQVKSKKYFIWTFVFLFSLISALFAGHLQTFFYLFITSIVYFFARWFQFDQKKRILFLFVLLTSCFLLLTIVQWFPTLQFILASARDIDQVSWQQEGWFIPWQHLIQFVVPDFFGNPTTLNYWGVWNYAEFVGYVGILPLLFSLFGLLYRHDRKTFFFGSILFVSLIFALPTFIAKLPYILNIPFLSTSQPTRLLFLTDFALAVLAALGIDFYLKSSQKRKLVYPILVIGMLFVGLWIVVFSGQKIIAGILPEQIAVAKRNLYFPSGIFVSLIVLLSITMLTKTKKMMNGVIMLLLVITVIDLFRFGMKFIPFTKQEYLFPSTKALTYLHQQPGKFRIMTTDSQIFPPNFSSIYHLESLDGYDPLYLRRYGELIAAIERGKPDISPPFGFNRIITPHKIDSRLIDLLGVKYVLSLSEIKSSKFEKVFAEGQTKVYKNKQVFPRTFFVENIRFANTKQEAIDALFDNTIDLHKTAIVDNYSQMIQWDHLTVGKAEITNYTDNRVNVHTENSGDGFLVFMDTYYPTWQVKVCSEDGQKCTRLTIHRTNYNFRGVFVPAGRHNVFFSNSLL